MVSEVWLDHCLVFEGLVKHLGFGPMLYVSKAVSALLLICYLSKFLTNQLRRDQKRELGIFVNTPPNFKMLVHVFGP